MPTDFYKFCLAHNRREHATLVVLSVLFFPLMFLSLDLPKDIVNFLTAGAEGLDSTDLGVAQVLADSGLSPVALLVILGLALFCVLAGRVALQYVVENRETAVGQRLLRRLRYELLSRLMRLPSHHWESLSEGETVSALLSETRDFSRFGAQILTAPVRQVGTFGVIFVFVLLQNWIMGLALLVMYPLQATVFYLLQRQIIVATLAAIRAERAFSDRVGETIHRLPAIHANDASRYELAQMTLRLHDMAAARGKARERKAFTTAVNSGLDNVLPITFYLLGGYLVLAGEFSIGALVAVIAAHANLTEPWAKILDFVQRGESLKGQFAQLLARFDAEDMLDESVLADDAGNAAGFGGLLVGRRVSLVEGDGTPLLDQATFAIDLRRPTAVIGPSRTVLGRVAHLLARLGMPTAGDLELAGTRYDRFPQSVTGRRIGYIGEDAVVISGTIRENLAYGLEYRSPPDGHARGRLTNDPRFRREARQSGNRYFQVDADWIDYAAAGVTGPDDLTRRMIEVLDQVELGEDVLTFGLGMRVDPDRDPELAGRILDARARFAARAHAAGADAAVEIFERSRFSANSSLAENIVFGSPVDRIAGLDEILAHPYMAEVLDQVGLGGPLLDLGQRIARSTLETFHDLAEGDQFHLDFSLIPYDDFPVYRELLGRAHDGGAEGMTAADRTRLRRLAFGLTPALHRFEYIDDAFEGRVLEARDYFSRNVPADLRGKIDLFDERRCNSGVSIESNIVFGRLRHGRRAELRSVRSLIEECAREAGMLEDLAVLGLEFHVGRRGFRLLPAQRGKLVAARVMLKRPDVIVVNNAPGMLGGSVPARIFDRTALERTGKGLIWLDRDLPDFMRFDAVLTLENGKLFGTRAVAGARAPTGGSAAPVPPLDAEMATLRRVPWFENWSTPRLRLLLLTSTLEHYPPGQFLFRQGESGDGAYVLVSGRADIVIHPGGTDHVLRSVQAPELVGEIALLCDTPRSASIVATESTIALKIPKASVEALIARDPRIALEIMRLLGHRLYDMVERYETMQVRGPGLPVS